LRISTIPFPLDYLRKNDFVSLPPCALVAEGCHEAHDHFIIYLNS
jgi:hypothetical protein